jgi:pimeloyl-ACP methyl ester carboxylesterase
MTKPTIVFVPGFWEGTAVYSAVTSILESQCQYQTKIIPLVSTGTASPHHKTFADDVRYIKEAVEHLVNEGKEIVLVGHSASAAVASEAVEGLARTERKENGLEGGISRLVFLAGSLAPERATIGDAPFFVNDVSDDLDPAHGFWFA